MDWSGGQAICWSLEKNEFYSRFLSPDWSELHENKRDYSDINSFCSKILKKKKKKSCWGIFISMSTILLSETDSVVITVTLNIM